MKIYEYDKSLPLNVEQKEFEDFSLISFDTVYEPQIPESKRVYVYHFKPKNSWTKLIFLHGIGNGNIPYLLWFGEYFKEHGLETFFTILPYHEKRSKPQWYAGAFLLSLASSLFKGFSQSCKRCEKND